MAQNTGKLAGRTLFVTGASRGIGKAIALKAARDGANVVIAAKTAEPHPKLPGTIYTAAKEIEEAGGKCLPCIVDVRDEAQVQAAVDQAVKTFGGIDIVVNNASAISITGTQDTSMKKYDLMQSINTRGTFLTSKLCLPHLKVGKNPHILNISPPLNMKPHWFSGHVAYTMAKYGMSMCVLGMAEELQPDGIAVNALWPRTTIWTAAVENLSGVPDARNYTRKPEIMADAAYVILTRDSKSFSGNFCIDDNVLKEFGETDLEKYSYVPGVQLSTDVFLDVEDPSAVAIREMAKKARAGPLQSAGAGGSAGEAAKIFDQIKSNMNNSLVQSMGAVFQFELKGKEAGTWYLDMKTPPGNVGQGAPSSGKPDVTMIMDSDDFVKLFQGSLKPTAAFMSGKLKIKGDMAKGMKLEKLMGAVKSKL
ncbi:hydroxysteroid dehydrogenase-like protein 2 [Amphiura filiformis]|uniref:hydroxysteroid dehydrogenase-like protein 2 n=1 Tax=Amphiura filiformis TaxID=82378 RepID=UPI003B20D194